MIEYHVVPLQLSCMTMTPNELHLLRVLYDTAKASRRDSLIGKAYTDRDFARDYLDSSFRMVTKVLSGKAISKPTTDAMLRFIRDTYPDIKSAMKTLDKLVKG